MHCCANLPDDWTSTNEGAGSWSALDVVAHLLHTERTYGLVRVNMILSFGESRVFAPVAREADPAERRDASLDRLLDEFARKRSDNMSELRGVNLQPADLDRRARHPHLGVLSCAGHSAAS
jgi:hypothetical protein